MHSLTPFEIVRLFIIVHADEKLTAFVELERGIYELAVSATNREGINQGSA